MIISYSHRKLAKTMLKIEDKDNYEWETHIFFDDAFEPGPDKLGSPRQVNQFVKLLIKQVDIQGKTWYGGRKMKVPPATKYSTPYGGRLVWTLPGETKIVCHLKDKDKIRHKKRWSQCMYMYFFLGHQIDSNEKLTAAQKKMRARNTYLLALDGDVDFQHDAIIKLVDLMKRNPVSMRIIFDSTLTFTFIKLIYIYRKLEHLVEEFIQQVLVLCNGIKCLSMR